MITFSHVLFHARPPVQDGANGRPRRPLAGGGTATPTTPRRTVSSGTGGGAQRGGAFSPKQKKTLWPVFFMFAHERKPNKKTSAVNFGRFPICYESKPTKKGDAAIVSRVLIISNESKP